MTLTNKVAVIFAANGAISSAVAEAFQRYGAKLHLSARRVETLAPLAKRLNAEMEAVDAMNEDDVAAYLDGVATREGRIDVVFNGIGMRAAELGYGTPSTQLSLDRFVETHRVHIGSQFITARHAARIMLERKTPGSILFLSASLSRNKFPMMAGISSACAGIEALTRVLATEFGPAGIRVNCVNPSALFETRTIQETNVANAQMMGISTEQLTAMITQNFMLKRGPRLTEVGEVSAFLASDASSALTGKVIDVDCGHFHA